MNPRTATTPNRPPAAAAPALALDFDGVLCDSAAETAVAAWRAGRVLWPEEWSAGEPPPELVARFCALRPLLETGYQAIALLRWAAEGAADEQIAARFVRGPAAFEETTGRSRTELVRLFGEARDRWIAEAPEAWLARHRFYPGVAEAVARLPAAVPLFILTTKQRRFTERLLARAGLTLPGERLFALESGRRKEDILADLLRQPAWQGRQWHFIEDRLDTLREAAARPELDRVRLYLAAWGYVRPNEVDVARADPRLACLTPAGFRDLVASLAVPPA